VPTLELHEINGDSAGNYYLMDEESTQGKGIPPGIISLFMRIQAGKIKMRGKTFER
jgi:hypothetical protein